jgi:hypothetical protein
MSIRTCPWFDRKVQCLWVVGTGSTEGSYQVFHQMFALVTAGVKSDKKLNTRIKKRV